MRLRIGKPSYRAIPAFTFMGVMLERFGVAMAISTFSLTENGTLEAGPLYVLERMPKAFDIPFGYWRHTITGPEGDNIFVTKGKKQRRSRFMQMI